MYFGGKNYLTTLKCLYLRINNLNKNIMKPSAPSKIIWILGLLFGILGIIGHFAKVDILSEYNYWLLLAGFGLLAIGTSFKGI